ncbi:hypothetical protein BDU57DRAFT_510162, partial [Ampelomyces quisqualis]
MLSTCSRQMQQHTQPILRGLHVSNRCSSTPLHRCPSPSDRHSPLRAMTSSCIGATQRRPNAIASRPRFLGAMPCSTGSEQVCFGVDRMACGLTQVVAISKPRTFTLEPGGREGDEAVRDLSNDSLHIDASDPLLGPVSAGGHFESHVLRPILKLNTIVMRN